MMLSPDLRYELRPEMGHEMDPELNLELATDMKAHLDSLADYVTPAFAEALALARSGQDERIVYHDIWFYLKVVRMIASEVGYDFTRPTLPWYAGLLDD
jgi:hypothetical protein